MSGPRWFADVGRQADLTDQGWQYVIPGCERRLGVSPQQIPDHPLEQA